MEHTDFKTYNVVDPKGVVQVYKNYYWWCVDGDPTQAVFYKPYGKGVGSPQCNANEKLAQIVGEKQLYSEYAKLVKIELAFVPWLD